MWLLSLKRKSGPRQGQREDQELSLAGVNLQLKPQFKSLGSYDPTHNVIPQSGCPADGQQEDSAEMIL